jgi:demethoxyubiquinone hydroxylase (CLK1/Coq7/Cat5 family)
MPAGGGKYDTLATLARQAAFADGIVMLIINGDMGSGFTVQAESYIGKHLPGMLRDMADEIENTMKANPPDVRGRQHETFEDTLPE